MVNQYSLRVSWDALITADELSVVSEHHHFEFEGVIGFITIIELIILGIELDAQLTESDRVKEVLIVMFGVGIEVVLIFAGAHLERDTIDDIPTCGVSLTRDRGDLRNHNVHVMLREIGSFIRMCDTRTIGRYRPWKESEDFGGAARDIICIPFNGCTGTGVVEFEDITTFVSCGCSCDGAR